MFFKVQVIVNWQNGLSLTNVLTIFQLRTLQILFFPNHASASIDVFISCLLALLFKMKFLERNSTLSNSGKLKVELTLRSAWHLAHRIRASLLEMEKSVGGAPPHPALALLCLSATLVPLHYCRCKVTASITTTTLNILVSQISETLNQVTLSYWQLTDVTILLRSL